MTAAARLELGQAITITLQLHLARVVAACVTKLCALRLWLNAHTCHNMHCTTPVPCMLVVVADVHLLTLLLLTAAAVTWSVLLHYTRLQQVHTSVSKTLATHHQHTTKMMRLRTGLLLLAGVALLACVLSSVDARALEGAQVAADTVATASPMKPISTVISWKTGKKYGDKYAHKDKHGGLCWVCC